MLSSNRSILIFGTSKSEFVRRSCGQICALPQYRPDGPDCKSDGPAMPRTVRTAGRTVRKKDPGYRRVFGSHRTVRAASRTVRPCPGRSGLQAGRSDLRTRITEGFPVEPDRPGSNPDRPALARTVRDAVRTSGLGQESLFFPVFDDLDGNLGPFLVRKVQPPHK